MPDPQRLLSDIQAKAQEIHTDAYPMSIGELMSIYKDGDLDIHPEFQRFFRWSELQKSKFVESILLGIPIPSIFVSQREDGVWDVVDGVQRLSTIFEFTGILRDKDGGIRPGNALVATEYLPQLEGMRWQDKKARNCSFTDSLRRDFKRQKIDMKIIKKESDENTKYDLFERLNTLGSKLSDQEVRNCLLVMINVDLYRWVEKLAATQVFQDTIRLSDKALRERYDMELLLRFLLLTRADPADLQNIRDVDAFITAGMRSIATDTSFDRDFERDVFMKTFTLLEAALGPDCFTRQDTGRGRGGFLISLFEVIAAGLGNRVRNKPDDLPDCTQITQVANGVGQNPNFRKHSKSGTSASSRIPRLVPLGRKLFTDS